MHHLHSSLSPISGNLFRGIIALKKILGASRQPLVALRLDSVTMAPVGNGPH